MAQAFRLLSIFWLLLAFSAQAQTQPQPQIQAPVQSQTRAVPPAFAEAEKMLGAVPIMFKHIPRAELQAAWDEFKSLQLSSNTAIPPKYKELIGAAVASQIPCNYCSYFHTQAAQALNGATPEEVKEAIAIAALTRKWSTFLNGVPQDPASFKRDLDRMFKTATSRQAQSKREKDTESGASMPVETLPPPAKTAKDVYRQAEKMYGFVPQFIREYPQHSVVGAWNQLQAMETGPTAIPAKYKSMISLAVASQVPCSYCVQMDTRAATANGATKDETKEAVALAANTRHWSTILNGNLIVTSEFKANTDQIINFLKTGSARQGTTSGAPIAPEQPPTQ